MGRIVPLRLKSPQAVEDRELLNKLLSSVQIMWRGGWAFPGDPDGVSAQEPPTHWRLALRPGPLLLLPA